MSSGDDEQGAEGSKFDSLFAAAEQSIDRLKAEKTIADGSMPGGFTLDDDDDEFDDVELDEADDAEESEELEVVMPARPKPKPQMPRAAAVPRAVSKPKSAPRPVDDALTQALLKAKNELATLLEAEMKKGAAQTAELEKVRARVERFKSDRGEAKERSDRQLAAAIAQARDKVIKQILPVADNLHLAVASQAGTSPEEDGDGPYIALMEGIENVLRLFEKSLGQLDVVAFSALGEPFDPNLHEAIRRLEDTSVPNNQIVEEFQRGYMIGERLLRPAVVVVAVGGPTE